MESVEFLSADLVRLAFVFGMVLSVFLYEKSHLTTGSIVVPGFLGIHFLEPQFIFGLILNSWICFLIVHRFAPRFFLMSARCKFHSLIVTSVLVQIAWSQLAAVEYGFIAVAGSSMSELGYVIPGLIAHDMSRNGALKTAANTLFVSYLVGALTFVLISFLPALALTKGDAVAVPARYDLVFVLTLSIFWIVVPQAQNSNSKCWIRYLCLPCFSV